MDKKLPEKVILAFAEIDNRIKKLYDKRLLMLQGAIKLYGVTSGVIEVPKEPKPFLRVTLKDNLDDFKEGKPMYSSAAFSRYSVEISRLKNKPKT